MLQQFLSHIEAHGLFSKSDRVMLAVSGGVDSMVMLDLFVQGGYRVGVAHCNFGLRGEEADADEQFVRKTCAGLDIPFWTRRFDTRAVAESRGISVQMAARDLRYDWFYGLLTEHNFDFLATAHHGTDNVETVLLNLLKGSGLDGLSGIPARSGRVVRPLLFAQKRELVDYAVETKIRWREDASNREDYYQRNFMRNKILPELAAINPAFERSVMSGIEKLSGARRLVELFMDSFMKQSVRMEGGMTRFDKILFHEPSFGPVLLWELIKQYGFNFDQCKDICGDHQPGKTFMSISHTLTVDRSELVLSPRAVDEAVSISITSPEGVFEAFGYRLCFDVVPHDGKPRGEPSVAQLDLEKLEFPLTWRHWKEGDRFVPLGMQGTKKVSDMLIDMKMSLPDKRSVTVLECGGHIVWLVNIRIADPWKVTDTSTQVLRIESMPHHL